MIINADLWCAYELSGNIDLEIYSIYYIYIYLLDRLKESSYEFSLSNKYHIFKEIAQTFIFQSPNEMQVSAKESSLLG